jgi:hypothetical protein
MLLVVALTACAASADVVERRGAEPLIIGDVLLIDDSGVKIRSTTGAEYVVPWDHVRDVKTDLADPRLPRFLALADDLWRARSRLERLDAQLSEPLFERLFERYRGQTHETALVVAEGLLRCRLARGAHALAVIPALETARLLRAGVTTDSYSMLASVIDEDTSLCVQLAPVWVPSRALEKMHGELAGYDAQGDEVVDALARLYDEAARAEVAGASQKEAERTLPEHPGVELLHLLVTCRSEDAGERESARVAMARRLEDASDWQATWLRFHLGVSLLGESGRGRRQRGLVHLLHLPARRAGEQPYLAGIALALVSETLRADGDIAPSESLLLDLQQRFHGHPVLTALADGTSLAPLFKSNEGGS